MTPSCGRVLAFREIDYQYGIGDLRLRVERIDLTNPPVYDGEIWYPVVGTQISADGRDLERRQLLVRGRCLPGLASRQA